MHILSGRILENGLITMEIIGKIFVATELALKGRYYGHGDGIPSRTGSTSGGAEAGLSVEYVQENVQQTSTELKSISKSCGIFIRERDTFSYVTDR